MTVYSLATTKKKKHLENQETKRIHRKDDSESPKVDEDSNSESSSENDDNIRTEETLQEETPERRAEGEGELRMQTKVAFSEPSQWVERMALTSTRGLPDDLVADDDPKREEAFIQQTLLSVHTGLALLKEAGVPYQRQADYYAEMYKSDTHMNDVRQAMEAAKVRLEAQAHRRSMKDQKKYGKEVQAEVMRQRAKVKREMQGRLSDWKKKTKGNRDELNDMLEDKEESRGSRRVQRQRNVKPGGGGRKARPGKNARSRRR